MRSLVVMCCMFFALLAGSERLAPPAFGAGAEWVLVDENYNSSFYYDLHGTTKEKPGVVRVHTKAVYTKQGKEEALKTLATAKNLQHLYESRYVHDIDCSVLQSKLLEVRHLDKSGATLQSTDLSRFTDWEDIPDGARIALVAEVACENAQSTSPPSVPLAGTPAATVNR